MSQLDNEIATKASAGQCILCREIPKLPKDDREDLEALIGVRSDPHIVKICSELGIKLGKSAVANHRAKHVQG